MRNKIFLIKLLFVIILFVVLQNNFLYARISGKNNNINEWSQKINNKMDEIANHFVDSVVQDDIEDKKYKGLEIDEVLHLKRIEALRATLSNAKLNDIVYLGKCKRDLVDDWIDNPAEDNDLFKWKVIVANPRKILLKSVESIKKADYCSTQSEIILDDENIKKYVIDYLYNVMLDKEERELPTNVFIQYNGDFEQNVDIFMWIITK